MERKGFYAASLTTTMGITAGLLAQVRHYCDLPQLHHGAQYGPFGMPACWFTTQRSSVCRWVSFNLVSSSVRALYFSLHAKARGRVHGWHAKSHISYTASSTCWCICPLHRIRLHAVMHATLAP